MSLQLTCNGSDSSTSAKVINDSGVAFDNPFHGQVASITCVGDFSVFENADSHFDGIQS